MIKDLDSKWDPGDRGDKWLKLKPDYVNANCDLDVLIIGGYFGSGRRGGEVGRRLAHSQQPQPQPQPQPLPQPPRYHQYSGSRPQISRNSATQLGADVYPPLQPELRDRNSSWLMPALAGTWGDAGLEPDSLPLDISYSFQYLGFWLSGCGLRR
eukprot:jgi/Mesen1/9841/ME000070S09133